MTNSPLHMPKKNRLNWRISQIACHKWIIYMCYICINLLFSWNCMNESCHMYEWVMSHKCVTNLIHLWDMTDSYMWHDSFIRAYVKDTTRSHDSFTRLVYKCPSRKLKIYVYITHTNESHMWFIYICPSRKVKIYACVTQFNTCVTHVSICGIHPFVACDSRNPEIEANFILF